MQMPIVAKLLHTYRLTNENVRYIKEPRKYIGNFVTLPLYMWAQRSWYSDSLRTRWSGARDKTTNQVWMMYTEYMRERVGGRVHWVSGRFPGRGVKQPECGVKHTPPSSAEVKERMELYLYSLF
jgi:hypothetical protein